MNDQVSLTIRWDNASKIVSVRRGLGLQAVCLKHPTPIEFDCRKADCGICVVQVEAGSDQLSPPTEAEADFLKAMAAKPNERLACQCRLLGDVTLHVETDWL